MARVDIVSQNGKEKYILFESDKQQLQLPLPDFKYKQLFQILDNARLNGVPRSNMMGFALGIRNTIYAGLSLHSEVELVSLVKEYIKSNY